MQVTLTEGAANHVKNMLAKQSHGIGLRLSTKKSGCTGFAYVVAYAEEVNEDDVVFDMHGVKLVVDKKSLPLLDGMVVDYGKSGVVNEGFEFKNPNVKDMCGCGESFSI